MLSQSPHLSVKSARPQVVVWYKAYLAFLLLLFLFAAGMGALILFGGFLSAEDLDGVPPQIMGGIYLVTGLIFALPCVIGFFLRPSKAAWVFHMVMICIGLSGCTIVFSVPLLIFWIKPEVKNYFYQT